jgi:hypothetical protein
MRSRLHSSGCDSYDPLADLTGDLFVLAILRNIKISSSAARDSGFQKHVSVVRLIAANEEENPAGME